MNYLITKYNYRLDKLIPINEGRYVICLGSENLLLTFKRDAFRNFSNLTHYHTKTVGDSINLKELKFAISKEVTKIFTIFSNGNVYYISMVDFMLNSDRFTLLEGKEVRSIDIHLYEYETKL
jgi:hypothetical protein